MVLRPAGLIVTLRKHRKIHERPVRAGRDKAERAAVANSTKRTPVILGSRTFAALQRPVTLFTPCAENPRSRSVDIE
jgi:hypothetical protein